MAPDNFMLCVVYRNKRSGVKVEHAAALQAALPWLLLHNKIAPDHDLKPSRSQIWRLAGRSNISALPLGVFHGTFQKGRLGSLHTPVDWEDPGT